MKPELFKIIEINLIICVICINSNKLSNKNNKNIDIDTYFSLRYMK